MNQPRDGWEVSQNPSRSVELRKRLGSSRNPPSLKLKMRKRKKHKMEQKSMREEARKQGFYDGRFRPRIVKDLKKHRSKRGSRDWKQNKEEI